MHLSIIVPCFNEEENVPVFAEEVKKYISDVDYEIIFVDDGSKDSTWEKIKASGQKGIKFSRNFGKEAAVFAGLESATGEYVVFMDADLQDPPHLLPEMLESMNEYDSVATMRRDRKGEPPIRSWFAKMFYRMINRMTGLHIVDGARDYRMMNRKMVDAILKLNETNRFSKGIFEWVGFKTKYIPFDNVERQHGETKWSFWKLFKYAIDGMIAFSTKPLYISVFIGFLLLLVSVLGGIAVIVREAVWHTSAYGWASTICLILATTGINLCFLGVIGLYLAKTYEETKRRPIYIIDEKL